jgi:hypothetical protein
MERLKQILHGGTIGGVSDEPVSDVSGYQGC